MSFIKLLIVDDHPVFRQGLRDVFETDYTFLVVGEAADGQIAVEQILQHEPDVVLMDINLPNSNGITVTQKLRSMMLQTKVVIITAYDDAEQSYRAIRAGASAYCSKDIPPETLITVVKAVQAGNYAVNERIMNESELKDWIEQKSGLSGTSANHIVPLSPREMEILELVTNGASNREIAHKLGISHQTVKNHMTAIFRKLHVADRTQAAVFALKQGWVPLEKTK